MFKHFWAVLNGGRAEIGIVNLEESLPQALEAIIRSIVRWFKPIWNFLDRQSRLFSIDYSNFNVWAVFDFTHFENWSDYICVWIYIRIEPNLEIVAARWIANREKLISNDEVEKHWMITEVSTLSLRDASKKFDHVCVI